MLAKLMASLIDALKALPGPSYCPQELSTQYVSAFMSTGSRQSRPREVFFDRSNILLQLEYGRRASTGQVDVTNGPSYVCSGKEASNAANGQCHDHVPTLPDSLLIIASEADGVEELLDSLLMAPNMMVTLQKDESDLHLSR